MAHFTPPGYGQRQSQYGYTPPQSGSNNPSPSFGPASYDPIPPFMTSNPTPFPMNPSAFEAFDFPPPSWGVDPSQAMFSNMPSISTGQPNVSFGAYANMAQMNGQNSIPYQQNINMANSYFGPGENRPLSRPSSVNSHGRNGASKTDSLDNSIRSVEVAHIQSTQTLKNGKSLFDSFRLTLPPI
jgi:hypothetical protein